VSASGSAAILGFVKLVGLAVLVSLASAVAFVLAAGGTASVWWSAIVAAVTMVALAWRSRGSLVAGTSVEPPRPQTEGPGRFSLVPSPGRPCWFCSPRW